MKVYILQWKYPEDGHIVAVYTSYILAHNAWEKDNCRFWMEIIEHDIVGSTE